jgi:uncharacterized membrane protein
VIKLFGLSVLLVIAGLIHLISPEVFLPAFPAFVPYKIELIYITGLLEIILAAGLVIESKRNLAALSTAVYLVLLLPVHIYVSIYEVEIFGISNSVILWTRTAFQFVLIYWALQLRTSKR